MVAELIEHLKELRADNAATGERLRSEQARDEKEKADITATVRTFTSYWEKHHPGEALPPEISGVQPAAYLLGTPSTSTANLTELLRKSMLVALEQVPTRFTTKEFFPLVPEIQGEDVPGSQGYDFLRRQANGRQHLNKESRKDADTSNRLRFENTFLSLSRPAKGGAQPEKIPRKRN